MKPNLSYRISLVLALAALLLSMDAALAYPTDTPKTGADGQSSIKIPCYQVIETAPADLARIDIPSRRPDYATIDRIADCIHTAGVSTSVPQTGRAAWTTNQYLEMKDHQAELMDKSGTTDQP